MKQRLELSITKLGFSVSVFRDQLDYGFALLPSMRGKKIVRTVFSLRKVGKMVNSFGIRKKMVEICKKKNVEIYKKRVGVFVKYFLFEKKWL